MSEKEHEPLFVVHWRHPHGEATVMVLCECCGAVRYSSAENIRAAAEAKLKTVCGECANRLMEEHGGAIAGAVRGGRVVKPLQVGDPVWIECGGLRKRATVALASPGGGSLLVQWEDGLFLGYAGVMPLLREAGEYRDLTEGRPVKVERIET